MTAPEDIRSDPRFAAGVAHFDRADFFEAHEEWEALWHDTRGEARDFVQGLIQVTSAMHHLQVGNMRGARQLHDSGVGLLAPYGDAYAGVDLKALRLSFDDSLREILEAPYDRLAGRGNPGGEVKIAYAPDRAFRFPLKP